MNQQFYDKVRRLIPELEIKINEPLKNHTTFRIGGPAEYFVCPDEEQLQILLRLTAEEDIPVTLIGNGSNLLIGDNGIKGLVIEIGKNMSGVSIRGKYMTIKAGTLLSKAANEAANAGLGGMEFAAGIPGSLGGAVVMNAGAYGGEMKDIIMSVDVLASDGKRHTLSIDELDFSYRHSCIVQNNYIVISAQLKLEEKPQEEIRALMAELREKRIEKQPLEYPSAGSTFKRPEGYFAGKLIQDAGLRGYSVGGAQVSEKHCGFVINKGEATASDVIKLIDDVKDKVMDEYGVELEPEVKMLGVFN